MTATAHEFFAASASVAGALIGLLFVAISVAPERVLGPDASEVHGVRAAATLTAFTNALTVSLFGLIPSFSVGGAATAVAATGMLFIVRSLIGVAPGWRAKRVRLRDFTFLVGLIVVFVIQLIAAIELDGNRADSGSLHTICILVVVCFLIGIERAWELVGGPRFHLFGTLFATMNGESDAAAEDRDLDPDA
ncbi:MAG TPA: hypothetical protein VN889_03105 [Solirubrobacteraceae bacterium]|nr:hypothetical protein [Solirubrobacteraceae bacterium]